MRKILERLKRLAAPFKKPKVSIPSAAGLVAALVLIWIFVPGKNKIEFQKTQVARGDLVANLLATGTVKPQNRLEIKPPIAGRIEEILVQEGDAVKRGQILAWMSSAERAALLDTARAKGPEEVAHWENLYKPLPIVSALSGIVINRNTEPGQSLSVNDAVVVLSDHLIVQVQVDETDIGQLKVGQKAEVILDAYSKNSFAGSINRIRYEAQTINNVTMYIVDVIPKEVPDFMRSGMTANVTFTVGKRDDVLILPNEAFIQNDRGSMVIVKSDGKKSQSPRTSGQNAGSRRRLPDVYGMRRIQTGLTDGKKTEILSGLEEGETVFWMSALERQSYQKKQNQTSGLLGNPPRVPR